MTIVSARIAAGAIVTGRLAASSKFSVKKGRRRKTAGGLERF
jgi:hypothetical protein